MSKTICAGFKGNCTSQSAPYVSPCSSHCRFCTNHAQALFQHCRGGGRCACGEEIFIPDGIALVESTENPNVMPFDTLAAEAERLSAIPPPLAAPNCALNPSEPATHYCELCGLFLSAGECADHVTVRHLDTAPGYTVPTIEEAANALREEVECGAWQEAAQARQTFFQISVAALEQLQSSQTDDIRAAVARDDQLHRLAGELEAETLTFGGLKAVMETILASKIIFPDRAPLTATPATTGTVTPASGSGAAPVSSGAGKAAPMPRRENANLYDDLDLMLGQLSSIATGQLGRRIWPMEVGARAVETTQTPEGVEEEMNSEGIILDDEDSSSA